MHWCQSDELATWWSFLSSSSNVSGLISPILLPIVIRNYGWRWCFYGAATALIVTAILNFFCLVDSPVDIELPQYDGVKQREANAKQKTKANLSTKKDQADDQIDWLQVVVYDPLPHCLYIAYMISVLYEKSLIDWLQLYLMQDKQYSEVAGKITINSILLDNYKVILVVNLSLMLP